MWLCIGNVSHSGFQWIIPILQIHDSPQYQFPSPDLLRSLVKCFFEHAVSFLPLLHRPTFEKQMEAGLHFNDEGFATVMMLVCSLGSRFSDDPRVLQDNTDSWYSAGWKWFAQVQNSRKLINVRPPRLYDLQICAVSYGFLVQRRAILNIMHSSLDFIFISQCSVKQHGA